MTVEMTSRNAVARIVISKKFFYSKVVSKQVFFGFAYIQSFYYSNIPKNLEHNFTPVNIFIVGCKCKDLISEFGWGNCKKVDIEIGKVTCYVKSPSNCTDLKNSNAERGVSKDEQYSAEACRQGTLDIAMV